MIQTPVIRSSEEPCARCQAAVLAGVLLLVSCATNQSAAPRAVSATLAGDYFSEHEVHVYDAKSDECVLDGVHADVMSVEEEANNVLYVRIRVIGRNFGECSFDGALFPYDSHQWRSQHGNTGCTVLLVQTPDGLVVTSTWGCYRELCGSGVTLDGTFLFSDRKPPGSHKWPDR